MWELPWQHFAIDWVRADANGTNTGHQPQPAQGSRTTVCCSPPGTYEHYAEPRHTTTALTEEAIARIKSHAASSDGKAEPLFLYLAYTAAHAPLEPLPHDEDHPDCTNRVHHWRRKFCGLIKGLDSAVGQVVDAARSELGENTVIVFTSDNGGAPWFGR